MTIGELKKLIEDLTDSLPVYVLTEKEIAGAHSKAYEEITREADTVQIGNIYKAPAAGKKKEKLTVAFIK